MTGPGAPYIDSIAAEKLFRHKILVLLKSKGLLSDERIARLAPTPREHAPFEKGKTSPCNRSKANKIPKPNLSRFCPKKRAALRKRWAQLIKRVHQTDPLQCHCGGTYRVVAFITEPKVIQKILAHLDKENATRARHPSPSH